MRTTRPVTRACTSNQRGVARRLIASNATGDRSGTTVAGVGVQVYDVASLNDAWWSEVFATPVTAGEPSRIGDGLVGMNLRYSLTGRGVPASVVVKLASEDPTSRATGMALRNYEREVKFYNEIASTVEVRAPKCHFAEWHAEAGDFVIVLEDMAPAEQGNQITGCDIGRARTAVAELARLHGPRWNDPTLWDVDWLQRRTESDGAAQLKGIYQMVKPGFLATFAESLERTAGDAGPALIDRLEQSLDGYVAAKDEPFTVTHGDYRLDNMLFASAAGGVACAVVDWQTPGHGNGIADLAYFIGAGLLPEDRRHHEWDLVDLYVAGVESYGHRLDREWVRTHYRREALSGVVMAVVASQIVQRTDRGDLMFEAMATRHALQALDHGSIDLCG